MTPQFSYLLNRLMSIYKNPKERITLQEQKKRFQLTFELSQYVADNDITDIGELPAKYDPIVNAEFA